MARAKKVIEETDAKAPDTDKKVMEAFSLLDNHSPFTSMMENAHSNIDTYDSTGCYALDALISGRIKGGGFPEGRLSILAAPSSTGKSYIGVQAAALAQKKGKYVLIFDSENAIDRTFCSNLGLDLSKCRYFPVKSIEQCKIALYEFLDFVIKNKLLGKFFILVDSLGGMISELDFKRAADGNNAADMGTYAKSLRQLIVMLANMSGQSKTTVVCTNHIYNNPNQMFSSVEQNQRGGEAAKYFPTSVIQFSNRKVKADDAKLKHDEDVAASSKDAVGIAINATQIKSRVCKPYITTTLYLSWEKGLSKYYGLLDIAKEMGLVEQRHGRCYIKSDSGEYDNYIGTEKEAAFNAELWENLIPQLQELITEQWCYKAHVQSTIDVPLDSKPEPISEE